MKESLKKALISPNIIFLSISTILGMVSSAIQENYSALLWAFLCFSATITIMFLKATIYELERGIELLTKLSNVPHQKNP